MDEKSRRSILVQKIQDKKTCHQCSEKAVFIEMKKLYCPKHYAIFKQIPLEDYEQRLTTDTNF